MSHGLCMGHEHQFFALVAPGIPLAPILLPSPILKEKSLLYDSQGKARFALSSPCVAGSFWGCTTLFWRNKWNYARLHPDIRFASLVSTLLPASWRTP